jgi:hypothetical protein
LLNDQRAAACAIAPSRMSVFGCSSVGEQQSHPDVAIRRADERLQR